MGSIWPSSAQLTRLLLQELVRRGGSGSTQELDDAIVLELNLSPSLLAEKRAGNRGEINYRLAWVRTKAKQQGLVARQRSRVWNITEKGLATLQS